MEEIRQSTVWTNQQYEPIQYIWEACSIDVFAIGPVFLLPPAPVPLPWKLEPVQVRPNQLTCESLSDDYHPYFWLMAEQLIPFHKYNLKIWIGNQILPKTLIICIYMLYLTIPQNSSPKKNKNLQVVQVQATSLAPGSQDLAISPEMESTSALQGGQGRDIDANFP